MTEYEKLLDDASLDNITVIENYNFSGTRLKGLYCDGVISLNQDRKTNVEKNACL